MQEKKNADNEKVANPTEEILKSGKNEPQNAIPAHEAAEADMQTDPDLNNTVGPDDGLDEGELAKLEGED